MSAPRSVNHLAYPTWDSAETHRFYTEVLGCRFVAAIAHDRVPSSGERVPYLHTFYELADGGCLAFFEVDGLERASHDGVPSWVRHVALDVGGVTELEGTIERVRGHGVDVVGPVDHDGTWLSAYLFDPNGVRIELTVQRRPLDEQDAAEGAQRLLAWAEEHGQAIPAVPGVGA